jgi:hypothetical protein
MWTSIEAGQSGFWQKFGTPRRITPCRARKVMAKKPKPKSRLEGRWRILWMDQWDQEYVDEEVEGYIEFEPNGLGSFQFGYVQGRIDYRTTTRDGQPAAEFSWEGGDGADGTPLTGRGWAISRGDELSGVIFIHEGDESNFKAKRKKRR